MSALAEKQAMDKLEDRLLSTARKYALVRDIREEPTVIREGRSVVVTLWDLKLKASLLPTAFLVFLVY